ncbi:putative ankyrin repeat protein [Beauveria bassiana]|nr:putative ankyrin repeat protein [Beauveria bassiana]KAH8710752.1 putative ankyrin repeat protein [Beauveria bassiana]
MIKKNNFITAISRAAETGNAALVRILLEAGAKVNSTCWMGTSVLGYAMEANNIKTVHLLFSQLRIDLNYWCRHQEPVLLTAVARDKLDLAEVLLPLVDPNQIGQEGITPLRLAVREQKASVVSLLLSDSRTNPNAMTASSSIFALACSLPSAKIAELLHDDWRTDVEFSNRGNQTPAKMAFYRAEVSNIDFPTHLKKRKTARHILFSLACDGGGKKQRR